jgi:hypothetical protein
MLTRAFLFHHPHLPQLRDWDGMFNQDDTIATAFVSLSQISNPTSEDVRITPPAAGSNAGSLGSA